MYILRPHGRPQTLRASRSRAQLARRGAAHLLCLVCARHPHSHLLKHFKAIQNQVESIITDQSEDIHTDTNTPPAPVWDLQDAKCILSNNYECCIDVNGFRFYTMERLFYALQLLTLGVKKYIRQLAKYTCMDYVKRCVNTRFELASPTLQDKWLCEQFQTWTQIITARILSDTAI